MQHAVNSLSSEAEYILYIQSIIVNDSTFSVFFSTSHFAVVVYSNNEELSG